MRVLFLSAWFPFPPNNGSKLRIYNLLRGLSEYHQVTLLSFTANNDRLDFNDPDLRKMCNDFELVPQKPYAPKSVNALLGFFNKTPRSLIDTFSSEMARKIKNRLAKNEYDLIIASQIMMASYSYCFEDIPAIFEEIEVGIFYEQYINAKTFLTRLRNGLTWSKHRYYLAKLIRRFNTSTVVSEKERQLICGNVINDYHSFEVIPNCVNVSSYQEFRIAPKPNSLIFTGSFTYFANYEAMVWFLEAVYPAIQTRNPDVHLTITGDHGNRLLPTVEKVALTGFIDDVRPLLAQSWCSVVPLISGGGTRLKILEAMALGTPVISTSKGAEGLDAEHGVHLLIADTPEAFADAVIRVLQEFDLRQRITNEAYKLVCEQYDWAVVMPRFLDLVEKVAK